MSNISCIIVSCQKSFYHRQITEQAIISSGVECIVVETIPTAQPYKCETLFWTREFNYNACLNFGIEHTNTEYVALCNNDLVFQKGWEKITDVMNYFELLSASPLSEYSTHRHAYKKCNNIYYGYQIGHELLGWCIVINREILQQIKKLDETYKFWCSDNAYADQLQKANIKHALVCNSIVNHIGGGSKTVNTMAKPKYYEMTIREYEKYASNKEGTKSNSENIPEKF
jgi:hypothetical protein